MEYILFIWNIMKDFRKAKRRNKFHGRIWSRPRNRGALRLRLSKLAAVFKMTVGPCS